MDGHIAVLGIHAHGDPVAVFLQHPGGKRKVRHRHAAQDAAPHAEGKIVFNAFLGADASAHLDIQPALFGQCGNGVVIGKGAVLRAVQIDDVEVLCACGQELPCLGTGILAVYGHAAVVALGQAHHLAAAQINGWKQLHHILLITPQTLSGCAGRCRRSFPGGTGCRTPCPPVPRR